MTRAYGRVKVQKIKPDLADISEQCGYDKRFKYVIDMNSNGIMGECIEWCQINCKGKWGWYFENKDAYDPMWHNWEEQDSYMSFEKKTDATKFWLSIGVANMGNRNG